MDVRTSRHHCVAEECQRQGGIDRAEPRSGKDELGERVPLGVAMPYAITI